MADLAQQHAAPDGTAPRLSDDQTQVLMRQVPGWSVRDGKLTRDVQVKDFRAALRLVNAIGEVAEEENHHPDLLIHQWNHLQIELYTHTAHGISENDFIMASKFDRLLPAPS